MFFTKLGYQSAYQMQELFPLNQYLQVRKGKKIILERFYEKVKCQNQRHWVEKKPSEKRLSFSVRIEYWIRIHKWGKLGKTRWVKCLSKIVSSLYSIWRVTNYRYVPLCTVKKDALGTWHISLKRTAFSPRAFFTPMSSISAFCFFKKKRCKRFFFLFLYLQVLLHRSKYKE